MFIIILSTLNKLLMLRSCFIIFIFTIGHTYGISQIDVCECIVNTTKVGWGDNNFEITNINNNVITVTDSVDMGDDVWIQEEIITNDDNNSNEDILAGYYISRDGKTMITDYTKVWMYDDIWVRKGPDLDGQNTGYETYRSADVSDDGNTVVVLISNLSGSVFFRVLKFECESDKWVQLGEDISVDPVNHAVCMGGNGYYVMFEFHMNIVGVWDWGGSEWSFEWIGGVHPPPDLLQVCRSVGTSADGNTVIIGKDFDVGDYGYILNGHAIVLSRDNITDMWVQKGQIMEGIDGDRLGHSVGIDSDGSTIIVGVPNANGIVIVYSWNNITNMWVKNNLQFDRLNDRSLLGYSVGIAGDGNTVILGAHNAKRDAGSVIVFGRDRINDIWFKKGQDLYSMNDGDRLGYSVDIDSDGGTIIVGSPGAYDYRGVAIVFSWDATNDSWTQKGQEIKGDTPRNDTHDITIPNGYYNDTSGEWVYRGREIKGSNIGNSVIISNDNSIIVSVKVGEGRVFKFTKTEPYLQRDDIFQISSDLLNAAIYEVDSVDPFDPRRITIKNVSSALSGFVKTSLVGSSTGEVNRVSIADSKCTEGQGLYGKSGWTAKNSCQTSIIG